jgi:hypothetical protein
MMKGERGMRQANRKSRMAETDDSLGAEDAGEEQRTFVMRGARSEEAPGRTNGSASRIGG